MDYSRFINKFSQQRKFSPMRTAAKLFAESPGNTIFMAGGLPNDTTFPFSKISVEVKDSDKILLEGQLLCKSLQYLGSAGYGPLLEKLKNLQTRNHGLDSNFWETREILITTGSLDGICKAMEMCILEGDPIVFTEPAYSGVIDAVRPYNPRFIRAEQDEYGLCPQKLRKALEAEGSPEEIRKKNIGVPKMLYVNPTGCNPSGATISTERKREIYKIACDYDLLILEDDPYFNIYFEKEPPVSFMSMDAEGRVLRFDSFSKILSAGMRLGFVTGPKALVERIGLHVQCSTMHAASLPQIILDELMNNWGPEGFNSHINSVREFYKNQRDAALKAANEHLKDLAEWTEPTGGMFLWLRIPGIKDVSRLVGRTGLDHKILLLSGNSFMLNDKEPCSYIRASYSTTTPEQMDLGFSRFAKLLKMELAIQRKG